MNFLIFHIILLGLIIHVVYSDIITFNYEKKIGEKLKKQELAKKTLKTRRSDAQPDLSFGLNDYPKPLPPAPVSTFINTSPNIYQGIKNRSDKRVLNRRVEYEAMMKNGHIYTCKVQFNCPLTYISVETEQCIPVLLNGGVGYNYMTVVVKAKAGRHLVGRIQAYCKRDTIKA